MARPRAWRRMPFIPVRYFDSLANLVAPGRRRAGFLADAGLAPERLDHPETLLSLEELERLVAQARAIDQDPDLALRLGAELNLSAHGTLGLAGLSSANLGQAIKVAVEHFPLVTPLLHPAYRRERDQAHLRICPAWPLSDRLFRFLLEALLASLYVQGRFLLEGHMPNVQVQVPFADRLARYREQFPELGITVSGQRETRLTFPAGIMDRPLPLANAEVRDEALRKCRAMLARLPHPDKPVSILRWLLAEPGAPVDVSAAAARMGLSERSLRRHLADQGQSFRQLALASRMAKARQLLQSTGLSVSETAFRVGYSDVANFSRAWKRHFGFPPGQLQPGGNAGRDGVD